MGEDGGLYEALADCIRTAEYDAGAFGNGVVDVALESLIVEVSGTVDKIDGLLEVLRPFGVLEMARTGRIAMTRGSDLLRPPDAASRGKTETAPASS